MLMTLPIRFEVSPAKMLLAMLAFVSLCGCNRSVIAPAVEPTGETPQYLLAPGDTLNVFVWRNPEVSVTGIPVRPDGRISTPLVEDMVAEGKTPTQLARDMEATLATYIRDPLVTVTVTNFVGGYGDQIRVVGEALNPAALPFRSGMTVLDVMIAVGGLTEFADGNDAVLIRTAGGSPQKFPVKLDSLLRRGDIEANMALHPGDVLVIPERWF